jgi:hypothetical protein
MRSTCAISSLTRSTSPGSITSLALMGQRSRTNPRPRAALLPRARLAAPTTPTRRRLPTSRQRMELKTWTSEQCALRLRGPCAQVDTLVRLPWGRSPKMKCFVGAPLLGKSADIFSISSCFPLLLALLFECAYQALRSGAVGCRLPAGVLLWPILPLYQVVLLTSHLLCTRDSRDFPRIFLHC